MILDRRTLLAAGLYGAVAPTFLSRLAWAAPGSKNILVVVMLRGAVDGLSVVAPYAEDAYYKARPTIAVPRPDDTGKPEGERLLRLDDRFGLHPAMAPLQAAFADKRIAFLHATGSPSTTRSHFDAQDFMESGTPDVKATDDGFLNRLLASSAKPGDSQLRAIAISNAMPRIMSGEARAVVFSRLSDLALGKGKANVVAGASFEAMYAAAVQDALRAPTHEVFEVARKLERAGVDKMKPENGAAYPTDAFGRALAETASLIKADVGVQVAFTDIGGWDTHSSQGGATGQLANRLGVLAKGLAAFGVDLGKRMDNVMVVAMSEFWSHCSRKRLARDRPRPWQLHDGGPRCDARRPRLRRLARTLGGQAVPGPGPRGDDGLSRRAVARGFPASRGDQARRSVSGVQECGGAGEFTICLIGPLFGPALVDGSGIQTATP